MNAAQNKLMQLTKELKAEWENTKQYWNDGKTLEFEKRFLNELEGAVNQALHNIDALERILSKVRDDCQ